MTSETGIPALKCASTNFPFWETQLRRHLDGVGESRIIDPSYRLPTKNNVTRSLNPFWVDPDVAPTGSSSQTQVTSDQQDPSPHTAPATKYITSTTTVPVDVVDSYSPGLKEAGGVKEIPYKILNAQMINMFSRLLDTSLHHLLVFSRTINPAYSAAAVFMQIKAHFSCSVWMTKDALVRRWEGIKVCTDPEATYNEILALNQECIEAGQGYSEFQVASKFVHLLQTADKRAYIHLLTELAKVGEQAQISQMWFVAQVTWKQIKDEQATPTPSQHQASTWACLLRYPEGIYSAYGAPNQVTPLTGAMQRTLPTSQSTHALPGSTVKSQTTCRPSTTEGSQRRRPPACTTGPPCHPHQATGLSNRPAWLGLPPQSLRRSRHTLCLPPSQSQSRSQCRH
jgi:hypothetical protein